MSPLHFISGDRWQHNIHCPFSPSAQICSQANRTRDHGPPNVYKHLPNKSPFPKLKQHHSWICSTRSSPGTLFFKKAKKPCVESHGREPTLKSNRDEKMRLKWWICPCCSKKGVCLESGISTQNRPFRKFQTMDFETSIHAYAHANSTNQQAKTITPADTSRRLLAQNKSQSLFPACCRPASVVKTLQEVNWNWRNKRFCLANLFPTLEIQDKGIQMSADDNVSNQVWQNAKLLRLCVGFTVRLVKTCCSQCVATCCYVMEPFKMYQNAIQHGILIGKFLTLYLHKVDPTWRSKTAFGWICRSVTHRDIHIPWVLQCGEVCDPSAAMGQCFVAFLCSLRCLVDGGANSFKPIGGEIHWLRFMLQICGKYESARANQQHWPIISPVYPTTLVEAMWDVWLYDDVSSALKQWYA